MRESRPKMRAEPAVGKAQESNSLTKVVFPAPFGPNKPNVVPRCTRSETPSSARTSLPLQRWRNTFDNASVSIAYSTALLWFYERNVLKVQIHFIMSDWSLG